MEEGLRIDTNILTQQEKTTTSLCDKYGVHVFGQEPSERELAYDRQKEQQQDKILMEVMTGKEDTSRIDIVQTVMTADTETVIRKDYDSGGEAGEGFSLLAYVMLGVFLMGAVLYCINHYLNQKRKDRRNHEIDDYSDRYGDEAVL